MRKNRAILQIIRDFDSDSLVRGPGFELSAQAGNSLITLAFAGFKDDPARQERRTMTGSVDWLGSDTQELLKQLQSLVSDLGNLENNRSPLHLASCVQIDQWAIAQRAVPCLIGNVTGHPTLGNGPTATSELFYMDTERGYARTLSRWYRLRTPCVPESIAFRPKPE
jgi:hypothetical protein